MIASAWQSHQSLQRHPQGLKISLYSNLFEITDKQLPVKSTPQQAMPSQELGRGLRIAIAG